ncbi:alpha/beta fold hydrolase [Lentibacillus cibarius]|uniref:Alpha/beta fold hydrolase n=1 Tax=Lentibacillus cibarius TaxID=2583219 RepID=A0A5S3R6K6_9BACI|nr:alpha/beta fold hydrolase [Lentibacillus cibarius]TMN20803.1 alpha/beta fold hydrolase [Lentibacillus cibarius]
MFAQVNGIKLFFDIDGAGYRVNKDVLEEKPVCFILHGGPGGTHVNFKPYLNKLTTGMQLVYIDNRGSGFSEKEPQSMYTIENNVEDIEALRKYLGLGKILLLGHSYGGMTAMRYAARYRENLVGMLLVTTSPSYRFIEKAKSFVARNGTKEQQEIADVLWEGAFTSDEQLAKYYEIMAPLYSVADKSSESPEPRPETFRSYEALNEGFGGFLREFDVTDELHDIQVPTLVIAGRHDWITPVNENELIAEKLPDSQLVIFENSSHNVIKDEAEGFNNVVLEFVKSLQS